MNSPERESNDVRLSPEDLAILAKESATVAGHTCKVILVGPGLDVGTLRASMMRRLSSLPALTRRLGGPRSAPTWVDDPGFNIDAHLVDAAGTNPLTRPELEQCVAELFTQRLERSRPLWRIDVLGPLSDGGRALVWRLHHALADGHTATQFAAALLWDAGGPGRAAPAALAAAAARAEAQHRHRRAQMAPVIERELRHERARSPFDGRIGPGRSVVFAAASLDRLRRAARGVCGATVNDVVLACVAGGLRHWLELHHHAPDPIRVKVPVSLHQPGDDIANRDASFYLELPLGEPAPAERLRLIAEETRLRKTAHDAEQMDRLLAALARVSPRLRTMCERFQDDPRGFAINVSNVKGPTHPVTVTSVPVTGLYSLADIGERHALRVAAFSMSDQLTFGLCADSSLVHDLHGLGAAVEDEARSLAALTSDQ